MTPKLWVPTLSSGCVSPRFLQAPQIQHIPNPWGHLTLPSSPNLLPQCALGWYNLIISASPKLWTHLSGQPSANLPPTSSVTKSYQFYFLKILQTVPDSLSLSVTFAPGHNFIQFTWSPCLQMHPLKSPPCPITYPSLKCSGTSSFLNVQASTMTPEPPDQALAHHYDLFLWLHFVF